MIWRKHGQLLTTVATDSFLNEETIIAICLLPQRILVAMTTTKSPLRVLFVTRKWPPAVGGMETYSAELCAELAGLVDLEKHALQGRADGYPPSGLQLARFMLTTAVQLWRKGRSYDVVHFGDFVLFPLLWLHFLRTPRVVRAITVHGLDLLYGCRKGMAPAVYQLFVRWAVRHRRAVSVVISNSANTARIASQTGFPEVKTIPLAVRSPSGEPISEPPADPPYVLFVGRLVPRKGARWFAEQVLPRLPGAVTLHVVGKVWDREEGHALKINPRVKLLGYLSNDDLARERRRSIAAVMPNITLADSVDVEGFGFTALEPALDGVPVVASAIEGLTDAVRDGETGFLLPERAPEAWAAKIREIIQWGNADRKRFAEVALHALRTHYAWSRVAAETLEAYMDASDGLSPNTTSERYLAENGIER